ncbi:MAG: hypothetical protein ACTS85_02955 [Arsenophonus sp. NC-PG7-MAG3]
MSDETLEEFNAEYVSRSLELILNKSLSFYLDAENYKKPFPTSMKLATIF